MIKCFGKNSVANVSSLTISPDGKSLAYHDDIRNCIFIYDIDSKKITHTIKSHEYYDAQLIKFTLDSKSLIFRYYDENIDFYSLKTKYLVERYDSGYEDIVNYDLTTDNKYLLILSSKGKIILIDRLLQSRIKINIKIRYHFVRFITDEIILAVTKNGMIEYLSLTGKLLFSLNGKSNDNYYWIRNKSG